MAETSKFNLTIGKKSKAAAVPSRQTMNFAHHVDAVDPKKLIPIAVVLVIAFLVFAKFGIIDQVDKKTAAYTALSEKQAQLSLLNAKLGEYDGLNQEYGRYSYGLMTEDEMSLVDRMQVLDLIQQKIMQVAVVDNYAINNNVLSVNLHGITLAQLSKLVESLENSEIVESAYPYSVRADEAGIASISMTIILVQEAA